MGTAPDTGANDGSPIWTPEPGDELHPVAAFDEGDENPDAMAGEPVAGLLDLPQISEES